MNNKAKLLFNAYLKLSESEKEEFERLLKDYKSKGISERRVFSENLSKSLGPIMGAQCPVCGK